MKKIKKLADKKYQDEFNFRLFLEQLIYLEDIGREKIEFSKKPVIEEEIGKFFEKEIKKLKL